MTASPCNYALKDLHEAIALVDRKIAHCANLERFDTQEGRASALRRLSTKRASLLRAALALTHPAVRCDSDILPRSVIHLVEGEGVSLLPKEGRNSDTTHTRRKRR